MELIYNVSIASEICIFDRQLQNKNSSTLKKKSYIEWFIRFYSSVVHPKWFTRSRFVFIRNSIMHYSLFAYIYTFCITSFLEIYRLAATVYRMAVIKIIPPSLLKNKYTTRIKNKHRGGVFLLAASHKPLYLRSELPKS